MPTLNSNSKIISAKYYCGCSTMMPHTWTLIMAWGTLWLFWGSRFFMDILFSWIFYFTPLVIKSTPPPWWRQNPRKSWGRVRIPCRVWCGHPDEGLMWSPLVVTWRVPCVVKLWLTNTCQAQRVNAQLSPAHTMCAASMLICLNLFVSWVLSLVRVFW